MKNLLLLFISFLLSFAATSQVVTGVYRGKMVSDSLSYTVDFELTLKEKNGEYYGYCQRLFLINDVLYYNLVKVKARIKDDILIVEDEKSVSNNFKEKRTGIKTVYMFNIKDIADTATVLTGDWNTSASRNLYAMPGKLIVKREKNYLSTQLYKRLEEKNLAKEMLFEEKAKPQTVLVSAPVTTKQTEKNDVAVDQPKQQENKPNDKASTPAKDTVAANTVATNNQQITNPTSNIPSTIVKDSVKTNTVAATNQQQVTTQKTDVVINQPKQQTTNPTTNKPETTVSKDNVKTNPTGTNQQQVNTQKTDVVVNQQKQQTNQPTNKPPATKDSVKNNTAAVTQPQTTTGNNSKPVTPVVTNPPVQQQTETSITSIGKVDTDAMQNQPVASGKPPVINNPMIIKRTTEIIDALEVTGDSVLLSLYDNGEIDGDTVSVFLNNELVVTKVGLRAQAFKHMIAIKPGEVVQLTLFAENLGSIPPNTGLLVITTNEQRYQVNFSSTLNKSSSIVIRRKE